MNTSPEKDFDALVHQVNEKLDGSQQNRRETIIKKVQNIIKATLGFGINGSGNIIQIPFENFYGVNMMGLQQHQINNSQDIKQILFEELYGANIEGLQQHQINAILLASDIARTFHKTKEKLEEEKLGKSTKVIEQIDQKISKTKEVFNTIYNQYKKSFYRD